MHFDTYFQQFFGTPFPFGKRKPDIESQDNLDPNANPNQSYQSYWNSGHYSANMEFENFDKMMQSFLHEMLGSFQVFDNSTSFQEPFPYPETGGSPGSLRDQMLKEPSSQAPIRDGDILTNTSGRLNSIFPKMMEDGMHYSTRSSTNYQFVSSNGISETRSTMQDREGCHREMTTKEFDGKKYVIEKKLCPGAPEQLTETLVNLSREELPEFLKKWKPNV